MASKFQPRKVSKAAGTNPIAQAVARKQVHDSIRDTRINLHMLEAGELCDTLLVELDFLLRVMRGAAGMAGLATAVGPHVLRQGHDRVRHMIRHSFVWDSEALSDVDAALAFCDALYKALPASAINEAIKNLQKGS